MIECAANGSESMVINWIRNDKDILNSHLHISNGARRSILTVNKATVDDSGVYQCIATNADNETVVSEPAELLSKIVNKNGICFKTRHTWFLIIASVCKLGAHKHCKAALRGAYELLANVCICMWCMCVWCMCVCVFVSLSPRLLITSGVI